MSAAQPKGVKIVDATAKELMKISAIERDGNMLVVKGKIFGTMPMTAKLSPEEARKAFGMLNFRMILFLLSFIFQRSAAAPEKK
jgi:hypothetical protein